VIDCNEFYKLLASNNVNFFTGVPDSTLKDFCAYVSDHTPKEQNIISANEGNAIALAAGYHLSTGNIPLVYMQNSGLGNAVNPLTSLVDSEVYRIPVLLLVGWRGQPGVHDEPQHKKQGKITLELLDVLGIAYKILPHNFYDAQKVLANALNIIKTDGVPYALVVRKNTFNTYKKKQQVLNHYDLTREKAIGIILNKIGNQDIVVSTTGGASREVYEFREKMNHGHERDFLTVGSMGHVSQIALGIALAITDRQVICLDGDGSLLMHMGALAITGDLAPKNFKHIVINNGAHDSVGGQPTVALNMDICKIAEACNYSKAIKITHEKQLQKEISYLSSIDGPVLLEVRVNPGSRKDLGRPKTTPIENKVKFIKYLR